MRVALNVAKKDIRDRCAGVKGREREMIFFKVFKVSSFKDNPALFNNTLSDLSWDRGKSYVCGDAQGQDDSGRSSHSESMVSETTYSVGHEYKVLKSSECTVRDCETFVVERVEPYRVNVTVNSEIVNFIVDTGSELTLLPEKVFTQLRIKSTMKPTLVKLKAYNGSQVKVLGETEMNLKLCDSNREFRINVVVVREGSCPILGRDVLSLAGFNFKSVFELEKCNENATSACQY